MMLDLLLCHEESDPGWEKRQEEKMQQMEEQLKWMVCEGFFR